MGATTRSAIVLPNQADGQAVDKNNQFPVNPPFNEEYEDTEVGGIAYHGLAEPGVGTDEAKWRIRRIVTTGNNVSIRWADGVGTFTKEWDERASYDYSS